MPHSAQGKTYKSRLDNIASGLWTQLEYKVRSETFAAA